MPFPFLSFPFTPPPRKGHLHISYQSPRLIYQLCLGLYTSSFFGKEGKDAVIRIASFARGEGDYLLFHGTGC